ncbi:hypothetical protein J8J14_09590 [Roseomonas sp. SSH11]|uniref:DUF6894 domain-containing protein n=1 Tax=Pararoseomonas baculiformis TaxID=2820812 RepID=A0ABS4ADF4_9PROT|nr:hypothetical protein [Pararoseomonas baculiformis]MBP0445032.1 hypothetical protein [Pararoseomonas baculiformis]
MFFFDLSNGEQRLGDDEGTDMPSTAEARREGLRALLEIARFHLRDRETGALSMVVRDKAGQVISEHHLSLETRS